MPNADLLGRLPEDGLHREGVGQRHHRALGPAGPDALGHLDELVGVPRAERLAASYAPEEDVLVYFNNDPGGAATVDAVVFADAVRRSGRATTRVPSTEQAAGLAWETA